MTRRQSRVRGRPARPVRAAAATAVALLLLALPLAAAADPVPTPTPVTASDEEAPLRIRVAALLPRAPAPGQAFEVVGTVTNVGGSPVAGVRVQLRVGERVTTRSALRDADSERPPTYLRRGTGVTPATADLMPGQTVPFDLRTTVDRLGMGEAGAYPLDIEATGRYGDAGRARLGTAPTWVPWMAGHRVAPTRVAVLWPLVDEPRRRPDDGLLDDALAGSVAPTGRLGRLLAAGAAAAQGQCDGAPRVREGTVLDPAPAAPAARCDPAPVTFAVDPDLLQTVATMSQPYTVHPDGQAARPGTGGTAARSWLTALSGATTDTPVLALPFGDPDVAALSAGVDGRYDVTLARSLGAQLVTDTLGLRPLTSAAWPPAGPVPPNAQGALAVDGTRAIVLDPTAFADQRDEPARTPDAHVRLPPVNGSPLAGLVPDADLSTLVAGASAAAFGPRLAEQRWIAETAVIAVQAPSLSRTLLVAPDRRGDVVAGVAAASLRDIGRLPWLCPVTVDDVANAREHCTVTPDGAADLPYDRGPVRLDQGGELSTPFLGVVARARDDASHFTDAVLDPRDDTAIATRLRLRRAVARAESSAWRGDPRAGRRAAGLLRRSVDALIGGLTVHGAPLLLTSAKGTVSVSVDNRLDVPVACAVTFTTTAGAVLTTPAGTAGPSSTTPVRTIAPHHSAQLSVQVTARTSGSFTVGARLVDREGRTFGAPATFLVRSTEYGRLALAVTGLGAGVLLLAAGARIVRRAIGSRSTGGPPQEPG